MTCSYTSKDNLACSGYEVEAMRGTPPPAAWHWQAAPGWPREWCLCRAIVKKPSAMSSMHSFHEQRG